MEDFREKAREIVKDWEQKYVVLSDDSILVPHYYEDSLSFEIGRAYKLLKELIGKEIWG